MVSSYKVRCRRGAVFPMDMLRHSQSWPADTASAALIHTLIERPDELISGLDGTVEITLSTIFDTRPLMDIGFDTSAKRWKSFGFEVIQPEVDPEHPTDEQVIADKVMGVRRLINTQQGFASENFRQNVINEECEEIASLASIRVPRHAVRSLVDGPTSPFHIAAILMGRRR